MTPRPSPEDSPPALAALAADFQRRTVVSRCGSCRRPCCRLETLVLELDWERLSRLWRLTAARREFDAALARGEGPPEIRAAGGLYYAFRRTCPGFDEQAGRCRVYESALKPPGCTDFPVYEEEGRLVADLRCEAVDLPALEAELRQFVGPAGTLVRREDRDFPFLVRYRLAGGRPRRGRRRSARA